MTENQFVAGFASALLLVCAFVLLSQVATWFAVHPQPKALVHYLTAPRFSILEIFNGLVLLVGFGIVLIKMPRL
ncbi:hypothetical protein [Halarchaeum salinum]